MMILYVYGQESLSEELSYILIFEFDCRIEIVYKKS